MTKSIKFTETDFKNRVRMCIEIHFKEEGLSTNNIIPITVSKMTKTMGYFQSRGKTPLKLNFSHMLLNGAYDLDGVDEIVLHEVIHYMVHMNGYYNQGHNHRFKAMCHKHGCSLDGTHSNTQRTAIYDDVLARESKYIIKCDTCGKLFYKDRICGLVKNPKGYKHDSCGYGMTRIK